MENNQLIPLVVAFTPNYFVPACVTIQSILENSSVSDKYVVYCLLTDDLEDNYKELLQILGGGRVQFVYINMTGKLEGIYVDERYTIAASFRLVLSELLSNLDKVIYLDCDIIVRQNLAALYTAIDLKDNYLAAVFEAPLEHQLEYIQSLGIESNNYFNSGFLVMNLDQLRKDGMASKFIEAAKQDGLQFPDQDVLNQLCQSKTLSLSPVYNGIRTFFLPQYKSNFLKKYTAMDWNIVQTNSNIHYTGGKPWNIVAVEFQYWWDYFYKLPIAIQNLFPINHKVHKMYKVHKNPFGKFLYTSAQGLYRLFKYRGK